MNEVLKRFFLQVFICASNAFLNLQIGQERKLYFSEFTKDHNETGKDDKAPKVEY